MSTRRQEAYAKADIDPITNKALDVGGHGMEPAGSAKKNEGFFSKGLLRATESDHASSSGIPEVKVVGNGHCHSQSNSHLLLPRCLPCPILHSNRELQTC